jgi:hypothetical protein
LRASFVSSLDTAAGVFSIVPKNTAALRKPPSAIATEIVAL